MEYKIGTNIYNQYSNKVKYNNIIHIFYWDYWIFKYITIYFYLIPVTDNFIYIQIFNNYLRLIRNF